MNAPEQFDRFQRNGKEILRLRPAWFSFWGSGIAMACVFLLWLARKEIFDGLAQSVGIPAELSALGLVIGVAPIALGVLYQRYTSSYEIEDGKVIRLTRGFISRVKREFSLTDKIQADMAQTIPARLLNYGRIAFWTGDDRSQLIWANAPDPDKIAAYINALKSSDRHHFAAAPPYTRATSSPASPAGSAINPAPVAIPTAPGHTLPTLAEAKKTKATHFGLASSTATDTIRKRIKTPFGHYIDNGDGTVSHEETGRMWIRAPWGMVWDGDKFTGDPIKLKWEEATRLFGRGAAVDYSIGSTMAFFGKEKRAASAFYNGYKLGKCRVSFAGYQDWRLPTGDDFQLMSASCRPHRMGDGDHDPADHQLSEDEVIALGWRWLGKANKSVIARLFPEFFTLTSRRKILLWSANEIGSALAWAYDGNFPVGDHRIKTPMGVMFVRQGGKDDYAGYKIEDETVSAD